MHHYQSLSELDKKEMLKAIGIKSLDNLFDSIPIEARNPNFDLGAGYDEIDAQRHLRDLSKKNKTDYLCFLGAGAKKRFIPPCVIEIASRCEFLTCYTPYQAEISQGSLQIMYEFQSLMCDLVNQDVSNASVYDGASALAEAIRTAERITNKKKVYIDKNINNNYLEVIRTYLFASDIEIVDNEQDNELCAKVYQMINKFGEFVEIPPKTNNELIISFVDIVSLALFEPPKADITVADTQSLGLGLNFGAGCGVICTKDKYKRQLPGRIVGKTIDKTGKTAYCLTLQAREQHIRRNKATSNICSNQALFALIAGVYLKKTGKKGFVEIAQKSYNNAHKLAKKLEQIGFVVENKDFFDEFTLNVLSSDNFLAHLKECGILGGVKLDNQRILVCATELVNDNDIECYIKASKPFSPNKLCLGG